ncbi:MAG TPA: hypothetical protein VJ697_10460 [Nitrososphaeraceae archaeon]|nr:hypothetical protein [Nitrososphaeraceae archaeon]
MQNVESSLLTISFNSRDDEVEGFYELLTKKIPIKSAGQHQYTINKEYIKVLDDMGINYTIQNNL